MSYGLLSLLIHYLLDYLTPEFWKYRTFNCSISTKYNINSEHITKISLTNKGISSLKCLYKNGKTSIIICDILNLIVLYHYYSFVNTIIKMCLDLYGS